MKIVSIKNRVLTLLTSLEEVSEHEKPNEDKLIYQRHCI